MEGQRSAELVRVVNVHHDEFAQFARSSYAADGRGVIHVEFPEPSRSALPGTLVLMSYYTLAQIRANAARLSLEAAAQVLIAVIETYDPKAEMVVNARFTGCDPMLATIELQRPLINATASGIHR